MYNYFYKNFWVQHASTFKTFQPNIFIFISNPNQIHSKHFYFGYPITNGA